MSGNWFTQKLPSFPANLFPSFTCTLNRTSKTTQLSKKNLDKNYLNIFFRGFQKLRTGCIVADSSSTRRGEGEVRSTLFKGDWMTLIHLNGVTVVAEPTVGYFVEWHIVESPVYSLRRNCLLSIYRTKPNSTQPNLTWSIDTIK